MGNCNHIEQAKHNEKVCNFLNQKQDFADWIITTAFYSALHYVCSIMIPYTELTTFSNIDSLFINYRRDGEGRHGFQCRWVSEKFPEIQFEYKRLHELSKNARYFDYKYDRGDSELARKYLEKIKSFCMKNALFSQKESI